MIHYRYYVQTEPLSVRRYGDGIKERWDRKTGKWSDECADEVTCTRDRKATEQEAMETIEKLKQEK